MNSFKITNFRVFDNDGVIIDLHPVTILTGANSSGKSSYVKALVLFKDWIDKIRNDYEKDGTFTPDKYPMDFTRADLKLKGFKNSLNRKAGKDDRITFSLDVNLGIIGKYTVEYAFISGSNLLDNGILDSIRVLFNGDERLVACRNKDNVFKTEVFKGFFESFVNLLALHLIPNSLLDSLRDPADDFAFCWEIRDEETDELDYSKLGATKQSAQLLDIQKWIYNKIDEAYWGDAYEFVPYKDLKRYPTLFGKDLTTAMQKTTQHNILFYFPVLEKFIGVSKEESIRILRDDTCTSRSVDNVRGNWKSSIDSIIKAYTDSDKESFLDFYRSLEDEFLGTINNTIHITTLGKSDNFIDIDILRGISLDFSSYGSWGGSCMFRDIYETFSAWQWAEDEKADSEWMKENIPGKEWVNPFNKGNAFIERSISYPNYFSSEHTLYKAYKEFVSYLLERLFMPDTLSRMTYFNGSFATVQRLHSFEENSLMVQTIRSYMDSIDQYSSLRSHQLRTDRFKEFKPGEYINKWLKNLGIGDNLVIRTDEENLGFRLFISKNGFEESVADLGHGITQIISLLTLIESNILQWRVQKSRLYEMMEGNQAYPSLPDAILTIEEPEVSLHPNYQSKLAELFMDAARNYDVNILFIIETHSEYLVRKTQAIVANMTSEDEFNNNPFIVYYFSSDGSAYDLEYTESGRFAKPFGTGFFDEAGKSSIEVLKHEKKAKG